MKERDLYPNEMYKKYCKELGGYVNVLYEENKQLLYDVDVNKEGKTFWLFERTNELTKHIDEFYGMK